jgi:hypothetical protein
MATRKAGKKSTKKGKTTGASKTKSGKTSPRGGRRRKNIIVPQEPIIIGGGGSVEVGFPKSFLTMGNPGKEHFKNPGVNLVQVVVVAANGTVRYRMALNRTDSVVVCFTGSLCI